MQRETRYIDLTFDYGFKIVFGNPDHPELMLGLLNALIPERNIVSIEFLGSEHLASDEQAKRIHFDILCREPDGGYFIVEMQKASFAHFTDRLVVYAGHVQQRLLRRGDKYVKVRQLYVISILDYFLDIPGETAQEREELLKSASLRLDDSGKVLSDKLKFLFLQLPAVKELSPGMDFLEELAWRFRNMAQTEEGPVGLMNPYFELLYHHADRHNISENELSIYDSMVRDEIQIKAEKEYAVNVAREQALAEGREEGREATLKELAAKLKALGMPLSQIAEITGLAENSI